MSDKPWGGRFDAPTDSFVEAFNASIDVDARMYAEDIAGSRAHATMLNAQGILTDEELSSIINGLNDIEAKIERGEFEFTIELEDVHMNIEKRLTDRIGESDYNQDLSRRRALETARLVKARIVPETIVSEGGGERPIFNNDLPEGRMYNRTVIVEIATPEEDL